MPDSKGEPVAAPDRASQAQPSRAVRAGLRGTRVAAAGQLVVATIAVLAACYLAKLVFIILLVAILMAFILAPVADLLERLRLPRPVAAGGAVLLMLAALFGASFYSYNRAQDFARELPKYSGQIRQTLEKYMLKAERLQKSTQDVLPNGNNTNTNNKNNQTVVVQQSSSWTDYLSKSFGSITDFLFGLGFIPFLVYFMLSWQEHVRASTVMLFRIENRNTAYVTLGAISKMIRSFIAGNVLVGLFMSAVLIVVFAILGLPYFYFVGIISGFLSLVPYLGVIFAMVPPLVLGIGHIHSTEALIIVGSVLVVHLIALNVLYPKIVGSRVSLNPLAVTLALLLWGFLWGAMGLILAVPVTAAMKIIFDHVESLRAYGAWLGE